MKEPHRKGIAIHLDPESGAGRRKGAVEALTGAHAGWVLSSEILFSGPNVLATLGKSAPPLGPQPGREELEALVERKL